MSKKFDDHSIRMKLYEKQNNVLFMPKTAILVRIDGKAFHSFTKGMERPFDPLLIKSINDAVIDMCKEIDGLQIAYAQSDEISLLITDIKNDATTAWFKGSKSKIETITASLMTAYFNKHFQLNFANDDKQNKKIALFDSRAWSMPYGEINNYFYWRQKDAYKNAISTIGRQYYSDKQLLSKHTGNIIDMLWEKGLALESINHSYLYGRCFKKYERILEMENKEPITRHYWDVDNNIPDFHNDKNYIEQYFNFYYNSEHDKIVSEYLKTPVNQIHNVLSKFMSFAEKDQKIIWNEIKILEKINAKNNC